MPTTYSSAPYHDDFDKTKQFHRILFRPGRAVQARELTQLQTILQNQIQNFGNGIYKEGSFVDPPKLTLDQNYKFVKLATSLNAVTADSQLSTLSGAKIIGDTSGVVARVVNTASSTAGGDPATLYVKYLNTGTNNETAFTAAEEIRIVGASSAIVKAAATSPTGSGVAFSCGECILFAKGTFLFATEQTLIVEKYTSITDRIIGYKVTEAITNSDTDNSLLDPAVGTFNYFAPGADRYKVSLTLEDREFTVDTSDDPNFVEIVRVQGGEIISKPDPRLSVLGDVLAKRTFDESGNYVVNRFNLEIKEHLRTTNANSFTSINDGIFPSYLGGNSSLFVSVVSPGKAYVKGYEVENFKSKYVNIEKARDYANVSSGVIQTQLASSIKVDNVHSIPNLSDIPSVNLHNDFNATPGTANGLKVGTAKIRGIEYTTGNVQIAANPLTTPPTGVFNLYLFDIQMNDGNVFERDVKQVHSGNESSFGDDFTANINPVLAELSGSFNVEKNNTEITGSGTRFSTELKVGDYVQVSGANSVIEVQSITNDVSFIATSQFKGDSSNGRIGSLIKTNLQDADKNSFIIKLPYDVIKSVDQNNTETIYFAKRLEEITLVGGSKAVTASTDETFTAFSTNNYQAVIASGSRTGEFIPLSSSKVTLTGSPTAGSEVTLDLSGDGLSTEKIQFYVTVRKVQSAAIRKTKTLNQNSNVDFTSEATATAATLSLGKADAFKIRSIRMSNTSVAFGSAFSHVGSKDITDNYTFDNGQKLTYYDLSKVKLKPGKPKPTAPVRVTFDWFSHGAGDYFSVNSYSSVNYTEIPEVVIDDKKFILRDSLDFRPRISDEGNVFTLTNASTTEFIDPEVNLQTDFQYYLPRKDKIVVNPNGEFLLQKGVSSLDPREPVSPDDTLALFVVNQKAYAGNLINDVEIIEVDNKRFTMRDIGKIDNRVKNLEYYTTLDLLEKDAQGELVKDSLGITRFKNGFLVDSFTGHGIGDPEGNEDYATSVNYSKREASPLQQTRFLKLREEIVTTADRTSNNYTVRNHFATLPYTEEVIIENRFATTKESLNPYNMVRFRGILDLDPPGDLWFDDRIAPDIQSDTAGNYTQLKNFSVMKRDGSFIFGSLNDIEQLRNGAVNENGQTASNQSDLASLVGSLSPTNSSLSVAGDSVIVNTKVIPKMRSATIAFNARGMKPNTLLYAFFDGVNVTNDIKSGNKEFANAIIQMGGLNSDGTGTPNITSANLEAFASVFANATFEAQSVGLKTDVNGTVNGMFYYDSEKYNFNTGRKIFRLTDSTTNNRLEEDTAAQATYFSDGIIREIGVSEIDTAPEGFVTGEGEIVVTATPLKRLSLLEQIYAQNTGRTVDTGAYAFWTDVALNKYGININQEFQVVGVSNSPHITNPNEFRLFVHEIAHGAVRNKEWELKKFGKDPENQHATISTSGSIPVDHVALEYIGTGQIYIGGAVELAYLSATNYFRDRGENPSEAQLSETVLANMLRLIDQALAQNTYINNDILP